MNTSGHPGPEPSRNWRAWIFRGVFEAVLIVLSVVIGLTLTQWAQDQKDAERVREMRGFIIQEMQRNREAIASDAYLPHHHRLLAKVREVLVMPKITMAEASIAFNALTETGVHFPPLDDSVWRSVSSGDLLEHMAPEDVFTIARAYTTQGSVTMVSQNLYSQISRMPADIASGLPPGGAIGTLNLSLADLVGAEGSLIKRYDEALEKLGAQPAPAPQAPKTP